MLGDGGNEAGIDGPDHELARAEEGDITMTNPVFESIASKTVSIGSA